MTAPARPILDVEGLVVRRAQTILDGIDWRLSRGENWVILGANGCGKTSLLAALTGYLTPTAGTIDLLGSRYGRADWRELRKRVGFVSNALTRQIEPDETAADVVASGPAAVLNIWRQPSPAERRGALRLLRGWNCAALAARPWGVLSQGERQRVLIARALLARPPLLLLDEPCAGLDPVARLRLLGLIEAEAARARGPAIVLITHHVEEITPAFTHALLLRAGRVVASGPIDRALTASTLSTAFAAPIRLRRASSPRRYSLTVTEPKPGAQPKATFL